MLGWIVRTALHTGMRSGEISSLRRNQIDLVKRTVTLTETKNGSIRTVPLSHSAAVVLRAALSNPVRPFNTDLVFFGEPGRDGKRRPYDFKLEWHRKLQSAGIKGLRFHDLRHEAVSRLVEAGLSDQEVAAISGHKSMQMLRRYTGTRSRLDNRCGGSPLSVQYFQLLANKCLVAHQLWMQINNGWLDTTMNDRTTH